MTSLLDPALAKAYADKRSDYYDCLRPEMMSLIPTSCQRLLDVGCGSGAFASAIKQKLGCEAWGVEPEPASAAVAASRLDRVICAPFTEGLAITEHTFDCIIFNDILEHLVDPAQALLYAKTLLRVGGTVVASIPNIGHFPTIWQLVRHGQWKYTERGILDKTHLRFFTRHSIREMFTNCGFSNFHIEGINPYFEMQPTDKRAWRYYRMIALTPIPAVRDMRYLQFGVRAGV